MTKQPERPPIRTAPPLRVPGIRLPGQAGTDASADASSEPAGGWQARGYAPPGRWQKPSSEPEPDLTVAPEREPDVEVESDHEPTSVDAPQSETSYLPAAESVAPAPHAEHLPGTARLKPRPQADGYLLQIDDRPSRPTPLIRAPHKKKSSNLGWWIFAIVAGLLWIASRQ